jgi:tetratricopeptide (TPR) repeat protein
MSFGFSHRFSVDAIGRPVVPSAPSMAAAAKAYSAGDQAEAKRLCLSIIEHDSRHFDALHLLGVVCLDNREYADALRYLARATRERSDDARAHYHVGTAWLGLKQYERAEAALRRALLLDPNDANVQNNLGNVLGRTGRHDEAIDCYRQVLAIDAGHMPARFNLGRSLAALDRLDEAVASLRAVLARAPADTDADRLADVQATLAEALVGLGRYDEALAACRTIAGLRPQVAAWNESLVLLLLGRFAEGWRKYEGRWGIDGHDPPRADARVPDLAQVPGKRILLISEQGRGDIIQFARYAPLLARLGAHVTLQVYVELKPLLQSLEGVAVIADGEPEPRYDIATPLLSLPVAFGTELATIPADIPYLSVPDDRMAAWRQRLGPRGKPRIGIAWSGAVDHGRDSRRSMALHQLAPLLGLPDFEFHSVQKDVRATDQAWLEQHQSLRDHGAALHDFADAAALISMMDLVIAVDTAAAHLAGALARPVWILLPRIADWRWLLDRDDSPWYPTARLFRLRRGGDWDGVVADVARALAALPVQSEINDRR